MYNNKYTLIPHYVTLAYKPRGSPAPARVASIPPRSRERTTTDTHNTHTARRLALVPQRCACRRHHRCLPPTVSASLYLPGRRWSCEGPPHDSSFPDYNSESERAREREGDREMIETVSKCQTAALDFQLSR